MTKVGKKRNYDDTKKLEKQKNDFFSKKFVGFLGNKRPHVIIPIKNAFQVVFFFFLFIFYLFFPFYLFFSTKTIFILQFKISNFNFFFVFFNGIQFFKIPIKLFFQITSQPVGFIVFLFSRFDPFIINTFFFQFFSYPSKTMFFQHPPINLLLPKLSSSLIF